MIYGNRVITMVQNALNLVDDRLVNHGVRVAAILKDMLEAVGIQNKDLKKNLCILAMFHDVGAYQTEEIDRLIQFETKTIYQHSIYGYLFLKEFTPLGELAEVVLYHHLDCDETCVWSEEIRYYAQMLHVADRIDLWHQGNPESSEQDLITYLTERVGFKFSREAVDAFLKANESFATFQKIGNPVQPEEIVDFRLLAEEEVEAYLWLVVNVMDFRSPVTVNHTVSVMDIGGQLAERMKLSPEEQQQVRYGALLHDLGKIGIPISILEKPARLTGEEMHIMRGHVALTGQIIRGCVNEKVERIALRHHEKLNSSGYPLGLSGDELTLPERILAVADIASALCMSRSYKKAFSKEHVFSILRNMCDNGEIDSSVEHVLEDGYDEITDHAGRACLPIREVYRRMGEEYRILLEKFKKTDENKRKDKKVADYGFVV